MTVSLRDLQRAKASLRARCRYHREEPAAACPICHDLAALAQNKQWRREREAAHAEYLARKDRLT